MHISSLLLIQNHISSLYNLIKSSQSAFIFLNLGFYYLNNLIYLYIIKVLTFLKHIFQFPITWLQCTVSLKYFSLVVKYTVLCINYSSVYGFNGCFLCTLIYFLCEGYLWLFLCHAEFVQIFEKILGFWYLTVYLLCYLLNLNPVLLFWLLLFAKCILILFFNFSLLLCIVIFFFDLFWFVFCVLAIISCFNHMMICQPRIYKLFWLYLYMILINKILTIF